MSFTATVFNIMIASPSDLKEERDVVVKAINLWNKKYAFDKRIVFTPLRWEEDSAPLMGSSPQAVLNRQLCERSDILIALFWSRIGSPTEQFESGTIEEINLHLEKQKPSLVFFSQKDISINVDRDQLDKLEEYKKSISDKSLYKEFVGNDDLKEQVINSLKIIVETEPCFQNNEEESTAALIINRPLTSDEAIVYFYVNKKQKISISITELENWMLEKEYYGFDVQNAFNIISSTNCASLDEEKLVFSRETFNQIVSMEEKELDDVISLIKDHYRPGIKVFLDLWNNNGFSDDELLFIGYLIDTNTSYLGWGWQTSMGESEFNDWGISKDVQLLGEKYTKCMSHFIELNFVLPCDYTSNGNIKGYSLCTSLKKKILDEGIIEMGLIDGIIQKYK